jgi:hypothetical protein
MDTCDKILSRGGLRDLSGQYRRAGCGIAYMNAAFEGNRGASVGEQWSRSTSGIGARLRRGKND